MRVPTRLVVSVAAVAAGASLITAAPAMADDTASLGTTPEVATTQVLAVPSAPTGLVALAGDGMATITFTPATDGGAATAYEYSLDGGNSWLPLSELTASSATAIVNGLANGQTYQVSLRGANAAGSGAASQAVSVTPVAPVVVEAPAAPVAPEVAPAPAPAPEVAAAPVVVAPAPEVAVAPAPAAPAAPAAVAPAAPAAVAPAAPAAQPAVVTPQVTYAEAVRAAVAAKMRYEAAVRAAVIAKWRQDAYWAAVRAAVAAKMRAAAAATYGSGVGYRAMQLALSKVGAPYVWGGQGPWGFDCSGLVAWAFRSAGYYLPGGSFNQIGYGSYVSYNSLQPGDLVFYGPGGSQHVAIYIGNGNVVQASNYNTGVHIASIWYIGSPTAYKRI